MHAHVALQHARGHVADCSHPPLLCLACRPTAPRDDDPDDAHSRAALHGHSPRSLQRERGGLALATHDGSPAREPHAAQPLVAVDDVRQEEPAEARASADAQLSLVACLLWQLLPPGLESRDAHTARVLLGDLRPAELGAVAVLAQERTQLGHLVGRPLAALSSRRCCRFLIVGCRRLFSCRQLLRG